MKIDRGSPIEFDKMGISRRLNKLNFIYPINFNNALDYGAGKGAYSSQIATHVKEVISIDIQKEYLSVLKKKAIKNVDILVSSCEMTCFKENTFESLFAIEVLEHLDDLQASIREIKRITKRNGIVYVSVPNKYFPVETHHVYLFNKTVDGRYIPFLSMIDAVHKKIGSARRFSAKGIEKLFNEQQFELIGVDYVMPPFDNFKSGAKFIKPLSDFIERSFLKVISSNIVLVFRNSGK